MEKNVIWAAVLSMAVLFVWQKFFVPKMLPQTTPTQSALMLPGAQITPTGAARAETQKSQETVWETIHTAWGEITLTSKGAAVAHWRLLEKKAEKDRIEHEWVDLVHQQPNPQSDEAMPLSTFADVNFISLGTRNVPQGQSSEWKAVLPSGLEVWKTYTFFDGSQAPRLQEKYFAQIDVEIRNPGKATIKLPSWNWGWVGGLGTSASEEKDNQSVTRAIAYPSPTKEVEVFKKPGKTPMSYRWIAVDNRYFLAALLPATGGAWNQASFEKTKTTPAQALLNFDEREIAPGESLRLSTQFYGGPKGYTHLKGLNLGLEHAVDFGVFGFLGKWTLKAMYRLYEWTGNYGWSIILLTIFLQICLFPLSRKSFQSMAAMKKLQPKIQNLQKRYKDDQKRLSQEMMLLYKESGTNPFGGCLPMILQIPVFWAFFTMLRNSIELRGAPWIFWIKDLSQHDPYYALPVIMGAGMLAQQKFGSAQATDPTQAKMMMFMPVVFTFMFLKFPSGLVLYWLTNSLVSMAMQFYFNRQSEAAARANARV